MRKEDYDYVVKIYNNIVLTQTLDTFALRKASNIILGRPEETLIAPLQAKQTIYGWYNYQRQTFLNEFEEMLTDDAQQELQFTPAKSEDMKPEEQSHCEDVSPPKKTRKKRVTKSKTKKK